jgi:hypothetical protein
VASRPELIEQIAFGLNRLPSQNTHHEFEHLCRDFARKRIASNVIPATGPVAGGGDQGRDFDTFRTYLKEEVGEHSAFAASSSEGPLVDDGLNHRVTVGNAIDTGVEDLTPPGSSEPTRFENIHHLAGPSVTVARATSSRVSGFGIEFEGKAGSSAPFAWKG